MPLLILSMGITEPLLARRAAYGRRVGARRNARRDALTQPLWIGVRGFLFSHRNTSCRHSTRVGRLPRNVMSSLRVFYRPNGTATTRPEDRGFNT